MRTVLILTFLQCTDEEMEKFHRGLEKQDRKDTGVILQMFLFTDISCILHLWYLSSRTNTEIIARFAGLRAALDHGHPPIHPIPSICVSSSPARVISSRHKGNKEQTEKGIMLESTAFESRRK